MQLNVSGSSPRSPAHLSRKRLPMGSPSKNCWTTSETWEAISHQRETYHEPIHPKIRAHQELATVHVETRLRLWRRIIFHSSTLHWRWHLAPDDPFSLDSLRSGDHVGGDHPRGGSPGIPFAHVGNHHPILCDPLAD